MPSIKDLKKRISTVKNTQQTTKAMKMVSAVKLRRAQEAVRNQRPYAKKLHDLLLKISAAVPGVEEKSPYYRTATSKPKILMLLVTSDRGLCGGFNSSIIKSAIKFLRQKKEEGYTEIGGMFVGKRGFDAFKRLQMIKVEKFFEGYANRMSYDRSNEVTELATQKFLDGTYDEVVVIFNEFINAASQKPSVETLLPIKVDGEAAKAANVDQLRIFKPKAEELFEMLIDKEFKIQTYRMLLESQAGEHGARMAAMENATNNAKEMIRKLELQYNKQRQAGITKELLEIISGSESQGGEAQVS